MADILIVVVPSPIPVIPNPFNYASDNSFTRNDRMNLMRKKLTPFLAATKRQVLPQYFVWVHKSSLFIPFTLCFVHFFIMILILILFLIIQWSINR